MALADSMGVPGGSSEGGVPRFLTVPESLRTSFRINECHWPAQVEAPHFPLTMMGSSIGARTHDVQRSTRWAALPLNVLLVGESAQFSSDLLTLVLSAVPSQGPLRGGASPRIKVALGRFRGSRTLLMTSYSSYARTALTALTS